MYAIVHSILLDYFCYRSDHVTYESTITNITVDLKVEVETTEGSEWGVCCFPV